MPFTHHKGISSTGAIAVGTIMDNAEVNPVVSGGGCQALGCGGGRGVGTRGTARGTTGRPAESSTSRQARQAAGLYISHWRYGHQAFSCKQPGSCSLQGNGHAGAN
jgi:hypothetical protein